MRFLYSLILISVFLGGCRASVSGRAAVSAKASAKANGNAELKKRVTLKAGANAKAGGKLGLDGSIRGNGSAYAKGKFAFSGVTLGNWNRSWNSSIWLDGRVDGRVDARVDGGLRWEGQAYGNAVYGRMVSASARVLGWGLWNGAGTAAWNAHWKGSGSVSGTVKLGSDGETVTGSACDFSEVRLNESGRPSMTAVSAATAKASAHYEGESPSVLPMLKVDGEMHIGRIAQMGVDDRGRKLLTCSGDKTAKLWRIDDGSLLRTFRIPVEAGNAGKLFACALSPDGKTAALGGWTVKKGRGGNIYLFDTASGRIERTIPGVDTVVKDLTYRPDGKYLVAGLGEDRGIRVYRMDSRDAYVDSHYGDNVYGVAFDGNNRLATASIDGYVRLYDQDWSLLNKVQFDNNREPFSVAFSPDGKKLAVAFADAAQIEVIDGHTLAPLYRPSVEGTGRKSNFEQVAFSHDCRYLYAGGSYTRPVGDDSVWPSVVRRWDDAGQGAYFDFPGSQNAISDLLPLSDGTILVSGVFPDFGRFTSWGQGIFYNVGDTLSFTNKDLSRYFTVNEDGSRITFKPSTYPPMAFDIEQRLLSEPVAAFEAFTDAAAGTRVNDWHLSYRPRMNGRQIDFLKPHEMNRTVDVSADGTAVFGALWSVNGINVDGTVRWRTEVPGETYGVNITADGSKVVAIHANGVIRWYRMSDGAVLLSLFVHPDAQRWIMWTPGGYYDAAPGADDLIGWHVNNDTNTAADFYPIGKFADRFYRPDVVASVLKYGDEQLALDNANARRGKQAPQYTVAQMLPPSVEIVSPQDGTDVDTPTVVIDYALRTPNDEKITGLKVLVDGRPLGDRGVVLRKKNKTGRVSVAVPRRDCVVSIVAENRFAASEPASIQLFWKGTRPEVVLKPNLYVLAIGISDYRDPSLQLAFAAKDARDFIGSIKAQGGGMYREVHVKSLVDGNATRAEVLDGLDWILEKTTGADVAMVFLAGHGVNDFDGDYFFLPQDSDLDRLKQTGIAYNDIQRAVSNVAGKALFFLDSCHSGNVLGDRWAGVDNNSLLNKLSRSENGVVVFASSTGRQLSLEHVDWRNGAFTKALVEGLNGKAAYAGTMITVNMLDLYLSLRVKELTEGRQTPATAKPRTVADFPVAYYDQRITK